MNRIRRLLLQSVGGLFLPAALKVSAEVKLHQKQYVSVRDFGAIGDGVHDDSRAMLAADSTGARVKYTPGRYLYCSESNLKFSGGLEFDNAHVNGKKSKNIIVFNEDNSLIGLQHNHLEQGFLQLRGRSVKCGYVVPPPFAAPLPPSSVDLIAHWYNDFGLEYTRAGLGKSGNLTWYYWDWAFASSSSYDARRHPLLGWYRGDDENILDWQCFWLVKYGISGVNLTGDIDFKSWQQPSHKDYWKFQLFNKVKNFKNLKYICWGKTDGDANSILSQWISLLEAYRKYNNSYRLKDSGNVVIYVFDGGQLSRSLGRAWKDKLSFYRAIVDAVKRCGFSGVTIWARKPGASEMANRENLSAAGLEYLAAGYSDIDGGHGQSYEDLTKSWRPPPDGSIANVATAKESVSPHPSRWAWRGSTPSLFESLLAKAFHWAAESPSSYKVIQIYNVAEWAEGGPGLQPNVHDGFGYLKAVKNITSSVFNE